MGKPELDTMEHCACSSVSVTARDGVLSMLVCSCLNCRKATGTGHSGIVIMRKEDVKVSGKTRHFDRLADSGAWICRHFCPICGTPVFATTTRSPALVLLPVGLFDNPGWFAPTQAIFSRTHLDWDTLPRGVPQYEAYRPH